MITLIAGICLGSVYQITKQPIARAEAKAKQEAYQKVFKNAEFEAGDELKEKVEGAEAFFENQGTAGVTVVEVMKAVDQSGNTAGYVMTLVSGQGYGGDIKMSLGIDKDGTITGLEILSMSETAGLGAKCTEEAFKDQFAGISADEITYTKSGKAADHEIDAISGATITTKAVTGAVNAGIAFIKSEILGMQ